MIFPFYRRGSEALKTARVKNPLSLRSFRLSEAPMANITETL